MLPRKERKKERRKEREKNEVAKWTIVNKCNLLQTFVVFYRMTGAKKNRKNKHADAQEKHP